MRRRPRRHPPRLAERGRVDWAAANAAVHGDKKLLDEICRALLEESPRLLTALRQTIAAGDAPGLRRAAHTLKSCVSYFGAKAAFEAAYRLEAQARDSVPEGAAAAAAELDSQVRQVLAEVARSMQDNAGSQST